MPRRPHDHADVNCVAGQPCVDVGMRGLDPAVRFDKPADAKIQA